MCFSTLWYTLFSSSLFFLVALLLVQFCMVWSKSSRGIYKPLATNKKARITCGTDSRLVNRKQGQECWFHILCTSIPSKQWSVSDPTTISRVWSHLNVIGSAFGAFEWRIVTFDFRSGHSLWCLRNLGAASPKKGVKLTALLMAKQRLQWQMHELWCCFQVILKFFYGCAPVPLFWVTFRSFFAFSSCLIGSVCISLCQDCLWNVSLLF